MSPLPRGLAALVTGALLLGAAPGAAGAAPAKPSEGGDPAIRAEVDAIVSELERGVAKLRLEGTPAPYRAEARLVRADLLSLDGSYGGVITDVLERQASGIVAVRVGSPERDNGGFLGSDSSVHRFEVPIAPAPDLVRRKVWLAMDAAYRGAATVHAEKLGVLEQLAGDPPPPDLAPAAPAAVRLGPAAEPFQVDREGLRRLAADLSARFADHPLVDNGDVHVQVLRSDEIVANTEGLLMRRVRPRAVLAVVADTRAEDGMHLDHGLALHFQSIPRRDDDLAATGEALVDRVLGELEELAAAPMLDEEYDGPILFSPEAAAQLLGSTIATQAGGVPPPLSDGGRLLEAEPHWQRRVGKGVMPSWIDVRDDPRGEGFGSFAFDAQGFAAEPLKLVNRGVLATLLMSRTPNALLGESNGRARMSPSLGISPGISNLSVTSRRSGLSPARMQRELLARAREDGYDFAYVVETLRDGVLLGPVPRDVVGTLGDGNKIAVPLPGRVFRVDADGKRTLVRGAVLTPVSMRVLRRIRAVGRRPATVPLRIPGGVFGGAAAEIGIDGILSQTVDVQITTPALLIDGLEMIPERGEHERPPTLTHPLRRTSTPAEPEL